MHRALVGIVLPVVFLAPGAPVTVPDAPPPHVAAASAADFIIRGTVRDDGGVPLVAVQVVVTGTTIGMMTSQLGEYAFRVPSRTLGDSVQLQARRVGYAPISVWVKLSADTVQVDLVLTATVLRLQSVVTTGSVAPTVGVRAGFSARYASPTAPPSRVPGERPNREGYDRIVENDFRSVAVAPLSTFSIDVDRAAYSNIRRFIARGERPPRDAVRIEEMLNYFSYEPVAPEGGHPFGVATEVSVAPWNPSNRLVRIGLHAPRIETEGLPRSNLVFLLDVSGSMGGAIGLVKQSLRLLVDQLREDDRVAIVVYAGAAGVALESTPGSDRERILDALMALEAGGSTAGGAGLRLAYKIAREHHVTGGNNRIILATDGDFNVGVSSDGEMVRLVEEHRDQGTFLTVLGFGMGNYQDSKLEKLSNAGNGNFAYIDDLTEARKTLVAEFGATLHTVAKDVKLQVEFNPARVAAYRLIGYENRLLNTEDFTDDTKDAGELGAGHVVTALYEIVPVGAGGAAAAITDDLRYQQPRGPMGPDDELLFVKVRYKLPDAVASTELGKAVPDRVSNPSVDFRFAQSVAAFGMILFESEHKGTATLGSVLQMARESLGPDREGYRKEFVTMVERFDDIARPVVGRR
jgi:Ca-activated chloride channel homolog